MTESTKIRATGRFDCRQAFSEELLALAQSDQRIVAVCNDSVGSSHLVKFRQVLPERLINVGIAEQDMVGVASGLAAGGLIPFVCAAAPFLTGRALDQIKTDVAYADRHVVLCGMSSGMAYGQLGPTHHSIEDLSWLRAVANVRIAVPADPGQTRAAVRWAAADAGPTYLRIARTPIPEIFPPDAPFVPGRMLQLLDGTDLTIVAAGTLVWAAVAAAELLAADGISGRILAAPFIEPLDRSAIIAAAAETGAIVTAEEATTTGGLGAAIAAVVAESRPVPVRMLGIPRVFAPTGSAEFLLDHFGLTPDGLADTARALIRDVR